MKITSDKAIAEGIENYPDNEQVAWRMQPVAPAAPPLVSARHTPGPWTAPGSNVVGADGSLVTHVPRPKGADASARRDANKLLIAAAPELLAACERMLCLLGDCQCEEIGRECEHCEVGRVTAKAKGGAT